MDVINSIERQTPILLNFTWCKFRKGSFTVVQLAKDVYIKVFVSDFKSLLKEKKKIDKGTFGLGILDL